MVAAVAGVLSDRKGTQIAVATLRRLPDRLIGGYATMLDNITRTGLRDPNAEPLFPDSADGQAVGCGWASSDDRLEPLASLHAEFETDRDGYLSAAELELNQAVNDLAVRKEGIARWFGFPWTMATEAQALYAAVPLIERLQAALRERAAVLQAQPHAIGEAERVAAELSAEYRAELPRAQAEARCQLGSHLADVLREQIGDPFRSVMFEPAWRSTTVVALARGIVTDAAFDRIPILADALEDEGCRDRVLLDHARGPGPHAAGCWVLDVVLDLDPATFGRLPVMAAPASGCAGAENGLS
jgi:hypothetical protein